MRLCAWCDEEFSEGTAPNRKYHADPCAKEAHKVVARTWVEATGGHHVYEEQSDEEFILGELDRELEFVLSKLERLL